MFFKPVLDKGAQMARHENTVPSAERIIRLILKNNPLPLQIQMELVKEGKDISETSAGEELTRELNAQIKKYKEEVRTLREEMKQAIKDKEGEIRGELEIEMQEDAEGDCEARERRHGVDIQLQARKGDARSPAHEGGRRI
jgi:hypothetical protein